jgi:hypothetical protein
MSKVVAALACSADGEYHSAGNRFEEEGVLAIFQSGNRLRAKLEDFYVALADDGFHQVVWPRRGFWYAERDFS